MGTHSKRISKGIGYYIIKTFQHHGAICFEVFRPSEVQTLNIVVILVLGFPDLLNIVVELVLVHNFSPSWAKYAILHFS